MIQVRKWKDKENETERQKTNNKTSAHEMAERELEEVKKKEKRAREQAEGRKNKRKELLATEENVSNEVDRSEVELDNRVNRKEELRLDDSDGQPYNLDSFIEVYGGSHTNPPPEWTQATVYHKQVPNPAILNKEDKVSTVKEENSAVKHRKNLARQVPSALTDELLKAVNSNQDELEELVLELLEQKADVNKVDSNGYTPLMWVSYHNNLGALDVLLQHSPNALSKDPSGATALSMASQQGFIEIARRLAEYDQSCINLPMENGQTPLHLACFNESRDLPNCYDIADLLVKMNANLEVIDANGDTSLIIAARKGSVDLAALLCQNGADTNMVNKSGESALSLALSHGFEEVAEILRRHGAENDNEEADDWASNDGKSSGTDAGDGDDWSVPDPANRRGSADSQSDWSDDNNTQATSKRLGEEDSEDGGNDWKEQEDLESDWGGATPASDHLYHVEDEEAQMMEEQRIDEGNFAWSTCLETSEII